ncbi:hypothetical protein DY023_14220 [Microbacterium bovistercoris]|uniref:Uncharacterized protein n=1 Tax=Microbacterium bovistercoris TaxID=2293570 RepID=A0A371NQZ4_9MICO|nr:hypothetical protein [Microbacterium bovistercoris]REJ04592.1 hypothetical protein DY023_14220 [Microbacterium bovistercoris]
MPEQKSALSRRTVLKGAAWSVPVIAVATAAPARATSTDPTTEPVLGTWRESSLAITQTSINASSPFVFCARGADGKPIYDEALWNNQPFEKTVTITYTGANEAFTFIGASTTSHYKITDVQKKSITLTHTDLNGTACSTGFTGFNLYFNSVSVGGTVELATIEQDSLVITASARAGDYVVNDIIDVTPCSPLWGQTPRGPHDVPTKNTDGTCPNGQPADAEA